MWHDIRPFPGIVVQHRGRPLLPGLRVERHRWLLLSLRELRVDGMLLVEVVELRVHVQLRHLRLELCLVRVRVLVRCGLGGVRGVSRVSGIR